MLFSEIGKRINPEAQIIAESALADSIFSEMGKNTKSAGTEFYLVYLPSLAEVKNNSSTPHESYNIACKKGIARCIDPTGSLNDFIRAFPDPERLFRCHYAKEIHEAVAREIKKHINL